jgi:hypothetical protein
VQQTGNPLYTQGADGSVSGRLPLGMASPCQYIVGSDGRLLVAGLERKEQLHFSIEGRPGESPGFVNDDLFFVTNPERITGLATGDGGRRYIFGESNIRELVGAGPNAAGVGEISEPVEIENRVGCTDWRSLCKTEHGVLFQSSASGKPKIYLLPAGGASAVEAGAGIRDVLDAFPIITSATRHDEEQLVTFTLQNSAGTDGRIVHLDLKTSGMGRNGWQATWLVDRVASLEAVQFPRVIEETFLSFMVPTGNTTLPITLPRGIRVGDRVLFLVVVDCLSAAGTVTLTSPVGGTTTILVTSSAGTQQTLTVDYRQTSATPATGSGLSCVGFTATTNIIVKMWLVRGGDTGTLPNVTVGTNAASTSWVTSTNSPSWGSARTLWLAACTSGSTFVDVQNPVIRGIPAGYVDVLRTANPSSSGVATAAAEVLTCRQELETASQAVTFTSPFAVSGQAVLIAVRPLTTGGTPARASNAYQGRLVVCNTTDVLRSDASAVVDGGSAVIIGEWEHADLHPMGAAGGGRHLGVSILLELLGPTALYAWLSYDGGFTYPSLREFRLSPATGFQIGQSCKLHWVPQRRKIDRVRLRLQIADDTTFLAGGTRGVALQRVTHWFEDLAGPARRAVSNTTSIGDRR